MLSHYLIVLLRHVRSRPVVALLNVVTLSLGLLGFLAAHAVVGFWERAEQHFPKAERTLAVTSSWTIVDVAQGGEFASGTVPRTTPWLAQYLRADFPELEAVARLAPIRERVPVDSGGRALRLRIVAADAELLEIFDLPLVAGDARSALTSPRSVVLTKDAAERLYGGEAAIGRAVSVARLEATVTAVLDAIPEPSHMGRSAAAPIRFDAIISRDLLEAALGRPGAALPSEDWLAQTDVTYVLLPENGSLTAEGLRRALPAFAERHVPDDSVHATADIAFDVVPVTALLGMGVNEAMFRSETGLSVGAALLGLGFVVLAVACVNFANLAAARAALRAREVGLRKAIGAKARHIAGQHLLEAGSTSAAALAGALGLAAWLAPAVENSTGIDLRVALFSDVEAWMFIVLTLIAVTAAAAAYPIVVQSRVQPLVVLRLGRARGGPRRLVTLLVGVQFTAAAFLLLAVAVVHMQNQRLARTGGRLAEDPLLVIENLTEITGVEQSTLRTELARLPDVARTTTLANAPWTVQTGTMPLVSSPAQTAIERTALLYFVGEDFFSTFDIPLLAGREFDPARADDVSGYGRPQQGAQHIVVSRALTEELGFLTPAQAVGETFYMPANNGVARPQIIIGVAEDKPLLITSNRGRRPSVYLFEPDLPFHVVRLPADHVAAGIAAVDELWERLAPGVAIERQFADNYFDAVYSSFARVNDAIAAFAGLALSIAATGLSAIAILVANRRMHEIGVRKTLGARTGDMALMLLGAFARPVLAANVVAWPFAYLAAKAYLGVFLDPIELTFGPFALCLAATGAVAGLAVGGQILRAARMTPARVLRQE